jgi:aryl-alcohol dehydrogenase-like predicted oxidoreductase
VVIATKGGLRMTENGLVRDSSPAWLRRGVDESLQALGIDHVDLYQVHWPDPVVPFAETAGALQELVDEGKIRHMGVSNFDAEQMAEFAETRPLETLQAPYHLFRRDMELEILPYCQEHDIGVLAYGSLAHGLLTGALSEETEFAPDDWRSGAPFFAGETYRRNLEVVRELERFASEGLGVSVSRMAIAWTLANPAVHVAIVGARRPSHIEDSIAAVDLTLSETDFERIDQITANAAPISGPSPEMMPE